VAAAVSALSMAAGAAQAATAAAADTGNAATVTDIVVTAQKREENLETVPVAVSAYTAKQRDLIGIDTIQDMTNFTPGLSYSTSLDRAFIRGVGRQTNNLSSQPGVATYNDNVYNSSVTAAAGDDLFVSQVEVLRGPQGTLYGRNAIGGLIDSVSRRPTDTFYAEGRVEVGTYDTYNFEGAMSGPLSDNARFRIAGYDDNQDQGYYKNLSGGPGEGGKGKAFYFESQLEADAGPVNIWAKFYTAGYDGTYRSGNTNAPFDQAPFPIGTLGPGAGIVYNPCFTLSQATACAGSPTGFGLGGTYNQQGTVTTNPGATNIRDFNTNTPERARLSNDYNLSTEITWHTGMGADLKYIGGYTTYYYHLTTDFDNTPVTSYTLPTTPGFPGLAPCGVGVQCPAAVVYPSSPFVYVEDKQYWSNEVDLTSTGNGPVQWIAGLYEYHEQYTQPVDFYDPQQTQLLNPLTSSFGPGIPNPTADYYHISQDMHDDSYAAFSQVDWKVSDQFKFTGGVRYSIDHEAGTESTRQITWGLPVFYGYPSTGLGPIQFDGALTPAVDVTPYLISFAPAKGVTSLPVEDPATGMYSRGLGATWSAWTGTAGAEWTPNSDSLYYAKYSRGYKAGGFNSGTLSASPETNPEFLDAYEVGAKNEWFEHKLQTNVALFYYNYDGMQIPLSVQPATGPATTQFFNMKQVISYGAELETVWTPVENGQILFNYSYLNAKIHDNTDCFQDGDDPTALFPGAVTAGCATAGYQKINGATVPESPANKISLNGNYTFKFDPGNLTLSITYAWKDATYDSIFNRPYNLAPAYDQVDFRITWTDAKDRYTVFVYGKNVFNTLGYDGVAGALLTAQSGVAYANHETFGLTPPATFGVEFQFRFK